MTTPSLPTTRPTTDTYGPDLVNDRPVTRRDRELDADHWNKAKADIAAACEVAPLAIVRVTNNGATAAVAAQRPSTLATATASRIGSGVVDVTIPTGVIPLDAIAVARGTTARSGAVSISGQVVRVTLSADNDFTLWIY